ncbi:MAG: ADP-ribosylglycohydrolase family protein [Candidatus Latescibacterota bacterium]
MKTPAKGVSLYSKVYGCIVAGAIGDTLGMPLEGCGHYKVIEEQYGVVTDPLDVTQIGTDDTHFAEVILSAYVEKQGRIGPEEFFAGWRRHNFLPETNQFYCLRNAYELVEMGVPPRVAGVGNIVTGSAIMCMAPVGIFNAGDPQAAYNDAKAIGFVHQRGLDVEAGAIYAACIAEAMRPHATVDAVLEVALRFAPRDPMVTFDVRDPNNVHDVLVKAIGIASKYDDVLASREEVYANVLQYHQIDPLEVLTLTLCVFKSSGGDVEQAIIGGANMGRDADTISNLAGALSAALNGVERIPERWMRLVEGETENAFRRSAEGMYNLLETKNRQSEERIASLLSLSRKNVLEDKAFGSLIGSAIGEIMGRPLPMQSYREGEAKFGIVREILDVEMPAYLRTYSNLAEVETEALYIQHILCRLYAEKSKRINNEEFAARLLSSPWPSAMGPRLGLFVINVLELLKEGMNPRATGFFSVSSPLALNACLPVAIYNAGDPQGAYLDTLDLFSCIVRTKALDCAAVYAAAVASAFSTDATPQHIVQTALDYAPRTDYATFDPRVKNDLQFELKNALHIAAKYDDVLEMRDAIREGFVSRIYFGDPMVLLDPIDALGVALAIFSVADGDPEQALVGAVNFGLQPSCVANLVGGLCGVCCGGSGLPERWVKVINGREGVAYTVLAGNLCGAVEQKIQAEKLKTAEHRGEM